MCVEWFRFGRIVVLGNSFIGGYRFGFWSFRFWFFGEVSRRDFFEVLFVNLLNKYF